MSTPTRRFASVHIAIDPTALEALRHMALGPKRLGVVLSQLILEERARREARARFPEKYVAILAESFVE
jgi:hypothetical protein